MPAAVIPVPAFPAALGQAFRVHLVQASPVARARAFRAAPVGAFLVECRAAVVVVVFRVEWPAAVEGALVAGDARSFPASVQQPFNS